MALNLDPSRLSLSKTSKSQLSLLCDIKCTPRWPVDALIQKISIFYSFLVTFSPTLCMSSGLPVCLSIYLLVSLGLFQSLSVSLGFSWSYLVLLNLAWFLSVSLDLCPQLSL